MLTGSHIGGYCKLVKIDLHGMTIHSAWTSFGVAIDSAYFGGVRSVVVVTGPGAMMKEFPVWAESHPRVREVTQHKHNPGCFTVKLKKVAKKG